MQTKYKGQITNFPDEVIELMLQRQVEQGNPEDVSVFEKSRIDTEKGFDWGKTMEGYYFWYIVIVNENFDLFFEKYLNMENNNKTRKIEKYIVKVYTLIGLNNDEFYMNDSVILSSESLPYFKSLGLTDNPNILEPVYAYEFKVGDYLYCHTNLVMNAYGKIEATQGKIYKIEKENCFTNNSGNKAHSMSDNLYLRWFRLATPKEIQQSQIELPEINGCKGKLEGDYIIYGFSNCNKFHKRFFTDLIDFNDQQTKELYSTRTIKSIKLNTDIEISIDQIQQIVDYIKYQENGK